MNNRNAVLFMERLTLQFRTLYTYLLLNTHQKTLVGGTLYYPHTDTMKKKKVVWLCLSNILLMLLIGT